MLVFHKGQMSTSDHHTVIEETAGNWSETKSRDGER